MSERFVAHLPFAATDLAAARHFAGTLARSLSFLPDVDAGEVTISFEDEQFVRHRVFCDLPLPDRGRCARRVDHDGPCGPRSPR